MYRQQHHPLQSSDRPKAAWHIFRAEALRPKPETAHYANSVPVPFATRAASPLGISRRCALQYAVERARTTAQARARALFHVVERLAPRIATDWRAPAFEKAHARGARFAARYGDLRERYNAH